MAARLFVRGKMLGKLQLDDYLIIGSVTCSWVNVATAIVAVSYGMGLHFATLTTEQKSGAIFWTMVGFPAGVMSFGLPKVAVVVLLTRILNPGPRHKNILWGLSLFCLLSLTANMVLLFIRCRPTQSNWDFSPSPRCWDKWILVHFAVYTGCWFPHSATATSRITDILPQHWLPLLTVTSPSILQLCWLGSR
ncbi:hypothetical protein C8035_v010573 [Colletotrichum spinosum]|uniref:Rhodopsin domain-containing protein n=1 Tax=Colletotrichum spinosum TaxID=1347390 RepID=A0A4R8Q773_9PEZI|nr:hypothetical protein C8035_v010573 [Colletotrichum spinosum]